MPGRYTFENEEAQRLRNAKRYENGQLQKSQEESRKLTSTYKGFAYISNSDKPKVIFGNSKDKMLQQLREWNKTRANGFTYTTCNIGQYDPNMKKHTNYEKFDVATGKNISNIYLEIPNGISNEEFQKTITYFKENGASFNTYKKQWYIQEEQKEAFKEYLPKTEVIQMQVGIQEATAQKKPMEQPESPSALDFIRNIDNQYVVDLKSGETIRISEKEMLKLTGVEKIEDLNAQKIVDAMEQKVQEHLQLTTDQEYSISISQNDYDNRCTVWLKNGGSIELFGDQFGVHFPSMEASEVSEIVKNYMRMEEMTYQETPSLKEGTTVTVCVPEYQNPNGIKEICNIREITGTVKKLDLDKVILDVNGEMLELNKSEIYNERQTAVMNKAISKKLSPEELDIVGQQKLSAAQMEQVLNGIQDGLSKLQVAMYANPSIHTWQMDIYRYGMENGIPFDNIHDVIKSNSDMPTKWEDSRRMVDKMIKAQRNIIITDLKDNKLCPEKHLVRKFEKLNGLTGKMYTVKQVMGTIREKASDAEFEKSENGKLMKAIGKEVTHQKLKMEKAPVAQLLIR